MSLQRSGGIGYRQIGGVACSTPGFRECLLERRAQLRRVTVEFFHVDNIYRLKHFCQNNATARGGRGRISKEPPVIATPLAHRSASYPALVRVLHWTMAIGFVAVWLTGVLTVNMEGLGSEAWDERQGQVRDLHKSLALTLVALAVIRLFARWLLPIPPLPPAIGPRERRLAHAGHLALYALVFLGSAAGLAIADLQAYGNAYFGIDLPQIYPTQEVLAGWSVDPWAYVLHAVLAYGLLALVCIHAAAVFMHRRHGLDLSHRVVGDAAGAPAWVNRATVVLAFIVAIVIAGALRGHLTSGPTETPRDYGRTTRPV